MSKWVVKKKPFGIGWRAWPDVDDYWAGFRYFRTWREAMDYADRMARTREVVLPRAHALPTDRHSVRHDGMIVEYAGSRSHPRLSPGRVVVEPWERRPLALALLALAEQEELT